MGLRVGEWLFTLQTVPPRLPGLEGDADGAARAGGFSLHAGVDIAASEREKLERLCRYVSRPPVASERLALGASGQARYTLRTPYRDGTTHVVLEPLQLMARLAALVPTPADAPDAPPRRVRPAQRAPRGGDASAAAARSGSSRASSSPRSSRGSSRTSSARRRRSRIRRSGRSGRGRRRGKPACCELEATAHCAGRWRIGRCGRNASAAGAVAKQGLSAAGSGSPWRPFHESTGPGRWFEIPGLNH